MIMTRSTLSQEYDQQSFNSKGLVEAKIYRFNYYKIFIKIRFEKTYFPDNNNKNIV